MKKILALALACVMMLSLGAAAMAVAPASDPEPTATPVVKSETAAASQTTVTTYTAAKATQKAEETSAEFTDADNADLTKNVTVTAIEDVKSLSEADAAAFQAAYDDAAAMENAVVVSCFWISYDGSFPIYYHFACEGEGVGVQVNGNEMEVASEGENAYVATITEAGAIVVYTAE